MSPYSNATPIVFNDRECSACASSGGTQQQLQALKNEGAVQSATSPQVAGTSSDTATNATKGQFVASKNSTLYHHISCPSAARIKPENQRWFATAEEAKAAGLSPSKCSQDLGY